jgi:cob(I)alamin adenosyltransferase
MEARIDLMEKDLPPLENFILPGGSPLGAYTHITRGICRRVERQTVALAQKQTVDPRIIKYLNRLSDLFFMLARFINKNAHVEEITWSGISRDTSKNN